MLCIFCLQERQPSREDIFPVAIGGSMVTDRVCADCNSILGTNADAPLCNHHSIMARRAELGLTGHSGKTPEPFFHLLKQGKRTLVDDPSRAVTIHQHPTTRLAELRVSTKTTELPDGNLEIMLDANDPELARRQLSELLQRHRKRKGLPALSAEDLERDAAAAWATRRLETIENPQVLHKLRLDYRNFQRGLFKIAYELAATWLGDDYVIEDPMASELRGAALEKSDAHASRLRGTMDFGIPKHSPLALWRDDRNCHIGATIVIRDSIAVAVKIFDVMSAVVVVSQSAEKYVSGLLDPARVRFVHINPLTARVRDTSMVEEIGRLSQRGRDSV
jgi:hypothetical protein